MNFTATMHLPIFATLLPFLITVLGTTVQPSSIHLCLNPNVNIGSSTAPCQGNHFRNKNNECQQCTTYDNNTVEMVRECNATHDVVLKCKDGHYVLPTLYDIYCKAVCEYCYLCGVGVEINKPYEKRSCSGYDNTKCCDNEDHIIINDRCEDPKKVTTQPTSSSTTTATTEVHKNNAALRSHSSFLIPYKQFIVTIIVSLIVFL